MIRKLASIQKVIAIHPIPDAAVLECADILGWHVVVKKGEFKPGDLCVYFEVDSLLPVKPVYEFLRKTCYNARLDGFRIKTVTMRGQISQGLALPLNREIQSELGQLKAAEGLDVTQDLGIRKYEAPVPVDLSGIVEGGIPPGIPVTDEVRIETIPQILEQYRDETFYVTEKLDGTSSTYYILNGKTGVCGRNWCYLSDDRNTLWKLYRELDVESKLRSLGTNIALQGEVTGPGIQKNQYKFPLHRLFLYNAYDIDRRCYLDYAGFKTLCSQLNLDMVPVLDDNYRLPKTVDEIKAYAFGPSFFNLNAKREGVVIRPLREIWDREIGRLSFKVISPEYLLDAEKGQA